MSTRLDAALQKHPEHEEGIRLLASRDPSRKLKYLDWGAKMLESGQALAPEIADVLDLFHRFSGHPLPGARRRRQRQPRIDPDIYTYRPQDLAKLRDNLLKLQRASDRKRRKREKLYRIEGAIEADVVYDSDDLIVRHIKNKQASGHYGLGTQWCIAMLREGYFEDYETQNAIFFFFERKRPKADEFDKVALMVPRCADAYNGLEVFTSNDHRTDLLALAKAYGARVFDIFREIYERSEKYPGSAMSRIHAGDATREQIESALPIIVKNAKKNPYAMARALRAVCCNDAAPWVVLEEIRRRVSRLKAKGLKRHRRDSRGELMRDVLSAMVIHPNTPAEAREALVKGLRRRRVDTDSIRRVAEREGIAVVYDSLIGGPYNGRRRRRFLRRKETVKELRSLAAQYARRAVRFRKRARKLEQKLAKRARA